MASINFKRTRQGIIVEQQHLQQLRVDRCFLLNNCPTFETSGEKYGRQENVDFSILFSDEGTHDMDKIAESIPVVGPVNVVFNEVDNNTNEENVFNSLVASFKKGSGQVIPICNKSQMTVIYEVFDRYAKTMTYKKIDFKEVDSFVSVLKRVMSTTRDHGMRVTIPFCLFHAIDVVNDERFSSTFVEGVMERFPNFLSLDKPRIYYNNNLDSADECAKRFKQWDNKTTLLMRYAMFCLRPSTFRLLHSFVPPECIEQYYDSQCFLNGMEGALIDDIARHMATILESLPASPRQFSRADSRFVYLYVSVLKMTTASFRVEFSTRLVESVVVSMVLDLINQRKIVPKRIMPYIGRGMEEEEQEYVLIQESDFFPTILNPSMFTLRTFSQHFRLTKDEADLANLLSCMDTDFSLQLLKRVIYETGYATFDLLSSLTEKLIGVSSRLENMDKVFNNESFKEDMDKLSPEGYANLYRLSGNTVPRIDFVKMLCFARNGYNALIILLKECSSMIDQENLFALAARLTILANRDDDFLPCRHITMLIENFPDLCHIPRLDFGIIRLCMESKIMFLDNIMDMKEIKRTVDRKYEFYGGATALCFSHIKPDYMVSLMIMGADPRILTKSGENALHFMARSRANDVFHKLPIDRDPVMLKKMREVVEVRRKVDAATPLMVAVAHGNTQAVIYLVERLGARCDTPFGMADVGGIRTVDAVLLLGQHRMSKNLMSRGIKFSKKLISNAALEGKLEGIGSKTVPGIQISATGLLVDYDNYKKSDGNYSFSFALPLMFPLLPERGRWHFKPIDGKTFVRGSKRILDALRAWDEEELRTMVSENEDEGRLEGSEFEQDKCPICLMKWDESMVDGENEPTSAVSSSFSSVSELNRCGHRFHTQCISKVLSNLCPMCRCPFNTEAVHVLQ